MRRWAGRNIKDRELTLRSCQPFQNAMEGEQETVNLLLSPQQCTAGAYLDLDAAVLLRDVVAAVCAILVLVSFRGSFLAQPLLHDQLPPAPGHQLRKYLPEVLRHPLAAQQMRCLK